MRRRRPLHRTTRRARRSKTRRPNSSPAVMAATTAPVSMPPISHASNSLAPRPLRLRPNPCRHSSPMATSRRQSCRERRGHRPNSGPIRAHPLRIRVVRRRATRRAPHRHPLRRLHRRRARPAPPHRQGRRTIPLPGSRNPIIRATFFATANRGRRASSSASVPMACRPDVSRPARAAISSWMRVPATWPAPVPASHRHAMQTAIRRAAPIRAASRGVRHNYFVSRKLFFTFWG